MLLFPPLKLLSKRSLHGCEKRAVMNHLAWGSPSHSLLDESIFRQGIWSKWNNSSLTQQHYSQAGTCRWNTQVQHSTGRANTWPLAHRCRVQTLVVNGRTSCLPFILPVLALSGPQLYPSRKPISDLCTLLWLECISSKLMSWKFNPQIPIVDGIWRLD